MTSRQDSASSTELGEGTNAGGAAPPRQGAPSEEPAAGAEAAAAGSTTTPEPSAPRMELDPQTEVALAGHMSAHGEADFLDPAICLICNNHTFGEAVVVTASCWHHFHPKCIQDAMKREKTQCPCGAAFPPGEKPFVVNPNHKRMMDKHKVQCPQGCGEVIPFGQLREHVHSPGGCLNTPSHCGNSGCGVLFLRKDKDEHLGSCPHRLVPCELCERPIKAGELLQHKAEQCPRRKVRCPHCQGEHLFSDTEEHMCRCTGGVSMSNITELKEMMAQMQHAFQATIAQQQQTIERQQSEIAELQSLCVPRLAEERAWALQGQQQQPQQQQAAAQQSPPQQLVQPQQQQLLGQVQEQQTLLFQFGVPGLAPGGVVTTGLQVPQMQPGALAQPQGVTPAPAAGGGAVAGAQPTSSSPAPGQQAQAGSGAHSTYQCPCCSSKFRAIKNQGHVACPLCGIRLIV